MSTKKKISVFIIDDHDSVRQSYIRWIEAEGFTIAGDEKYPDKAVEKIKKTTPMSSSWILTSQTINSVA
jgi:chemotaxis response regulator CheB